MQQMACRVANDTVPEMLFGYCFKPQLVDFD